MSALGLAALAVAQADLVAGVRGGQPGRFESPEVAARLAAVGLDRPAPWCAAEVFHCFEVACSTPDVDDVRGLSVPNPCPRTASALHLWELAPLQCRTQLPAPGDVFIVDHGQGRGHCGIVATVSPDGQSITSVEGDTNAAGSSTGDAMGEHFWKPSDGARGRLVGYLDLGA